MSAKVLKMPERHYRPEIEKLVAVIDTMSGEPGAYFDLALYILRQVEKQRGNPDPKPTDMQAAINGMALACFALALEIGIPRKIIFGVLPDGGAPPSSGGRARR